MNGSRGRQKTEKERWKRDKAVATDQEPDQETRRKNSHIALGSQAADDKRLVKVVNGRVGDAASDLSGRSPHELSCDNQVSTR